MQEKTGFCISELVKRFGGEFFGEDVNVRGIAPLDCASANMISFLSNPKLKSQLNQTAAAAVIVKPADADDLTIPHIVTKDPYLYFARVAQLFHPLPTPASGIHLTAIVASDAQIDPTAEIGPLVVIESGAKIGARTIIKAGSTIGVGVSIGDDCLFYPRVTVYQDCVVGSRVIVHAGAVLGSDGFGNAWAGDHWEKIPQTGRVLIGDDVEIGANTTIDRGALGDTVVAHGARIDNQIQLGHNVEIGAFTAIAACSGIAGSTRIGAGCLIGGDVGMAGHLKIADRVTILGGSSVASDIDQPGVYGSATSTMPYAVWRRNVIHNRHLDELVKRVKVLEKQLGSMNEPSSEIGSQE